MRPTGLSGNSADLFLAIVSPDATLLLRLLGAMEKSHASRD